MRVFKIEFNNIMTPLDAQKSYVSYFENALQIYKIGTRTKKGYSQTLNKLFLQVLISIMISLNHFVYKGIL